MKKNSKLYRLTITGVNLNRLYKQAREKNVNLYNINRVEYKRIIVDIKKKDLRTINQISKLNGYSINIERSYGVERIYNAFYSNIGLIIGSFVSLIVLLVSSLFIWTVKIYGNETVKSNEIIDFLHTNGIYVGGRKRDIDLEKIENNLINNFENISMCSIVTRGSTIIINIKEKIPDSLNDSNGENDIIADKNMTINEIHVLQGTPLIKAGDSVKKGDIIVAGFFENNGVKIKCHANAIINATVWYSETEELLKEKEVLIRTGRAVTKVTMSFLGVNSKVKECVIPFEEYEKETYSNQIFKNSFIPLCINTENFFEVRREKISQNFEEMKEGIISNLQNKVCSQIGSGEEISKSFYTVSENKTSYFITYYIGVKINF